MKEGVAIKLAICGSMALILFLLMYHPSPTDQQVRNKINQSLLGRAVDYKYMGGATISFRISADQIRSIEKKVDGNGTTTWVVVWRSGPYGYEFYFDEFGENEIGSKPLPVQ